ncbi:hypothetical protein FOCG_02672 [Fusarium oxysporum f. sp. radicis-lycopersici 26381]|uniref:Uncharacterized protein n=5 Tax=Fusarium oxysporum TaxID=5507 RepID=A0A0J9UZZ0_FUSO4|nr:hypothetical protein FOXG_19234 [Fusarium oxysporum f. sp. lycopersici 4287]EWZ42138.1 hypothetical protein FOZG_07172 [Fusarium oxysporum Fo47]EXA00761.1 hypothetical protein FOWG_00872 [Fusarium oxysporum f. sp. lycopersici MN25]EXA47587.1 hypothetical protein FOVG_04649 [Fusarium oxysporum f. sp. pisi HDV247]EXK35276.1 hypothetical protein FOMG_10459 [Fusarium oxysporum f. sp. melonis 26406]EXL59447.1 hypothetical protein FOCG_02672 [Fusarium oxysporum f. sp. radicis-lycopersici 26381]E
MANVSKAWGYERQVWVMSAGEADVDHDGVRHYRGSKWG